MTAVDEHRLGEELVANGSAGAAADRFLCHGNSGEEKAQNLLSVAVRQFDFVLKISSGLILTD
jgi:hypothetical protein